MSQYEKKPELVEKILYWAKRKVGEEWTLQDVAWLEMQLENVWHAAEQEGHYSAMDNPPEIGEELETMQRRAGIKKS